MNASAVRVGMSVNDLEVTAISRVDHTCVITLANGTCLTVPHYAQIDARVNFGARLDCGPVRSKYITAPRDSRASSKEWRGESDGRRGERTVADMPSHSPGHSFPAKKPTGSFKHLLTKRG